MRFKVCKNTFADLKLLSFLRSKLSIKRILILSKNKKHQRFEQNYYATVLLLDSYPAAFRL